MEVGPTNNSLGTRRSLQQSYLDMQGGKLFFPWTYIGPCFFQFGLGSRGTEAVQVAQAPVAEDTAPAHGYSHEV